MNGEAPEIATQADPERALVAALLLSPAELVDVAPLVAPDDFTSAAHRDVFAAMLEADAARDTLDVVVLGERLAGNARALSALHEAALESPMGKAARYAGLVRDASLRREIAVRASAAARSAQDRSVPAEVHLDRAEAGLAALRRDAGRSAVTVGESLNRLFPELEARYNRQTDVTGLSTGLVDLDRQTCGLHPGQLVIVAGRPGMGKSAVAAKFARVCASTGVPALVFSLEMSADEITSRLLADEAGVDGHRLKTGRFLDSDWPKLARASDLLSRLPLVIDDTPSPTLLEIRAKARTVKAKRGGLGVVVIDYLQLARGIGDNREQEVASLSRGLKILAKELGCPVVACAQLNRAVAKQADKRPGLSDLRESGAIEQDADVVIFVYRDEIYDANTADKGIAEIIVGKQRNGPTGTVRVRFVGEFTRFCDLEERRDRWQGEA